MQPKSSKNSVYNNGKTSSSQELLYQHMSNHYRRILNAKKTVDTSPPYCYKPRRHSKAKRLTSISTTRNNIGGGKKDGLSRNTSPALTERSLSTNSYKESFWGTESVVGSSRYHAGCVQNDTKPVAPPKNIIFNMDLINRITYDTKHGPSAYCEENWQESKPGQTRQREKKFKAPVKSNKNRTNLMTNFNKRPLQARENGTKQKRKFSAKSKYASADVMERQSHLFASFNSKFFPRILKTDAVSKLRSLRVYHPPRRKERRIKEEGSTELSERRSLDPDDCKCTKICVCDENEETLDLKKNPEHPKEQSQTSSRDSAYNGGVSSLPESRSPTPDQRRKKEYACILEDEPFFCNQNGDKEEICEDSKNVKDARGYDSSRNELPRIDSSDSDSTTKLKPESEDSLKKLQDDALYIQFIQDITVEILEKSLYTNKALKRVMKRHLINNLQTLDKDRMIKELENLRIQLGIPEDDKFFDTELDPIENVESFTEFLTPYPVISDSAFGLPKSASLEPEGESNESKKAEEKEEEIPKTKDRKDDLKSEETKQALMEEIDAIALESDSGDDEELVSVIQMARASREKRKEKSEKVVKTKEGSSSEESDEPVKCKNKIEIQKCCQCCQCSNGASSDSEEKENRSERITVKTKRNKSDDSDYVFDGSSFSYY